MERKGNQGIFRNPRLLTFLQPEDLNKFYESKKVEVKCAPPSKDIEVLTRHCLLPQNFPPCPQKYLL